MPIYEYKCEKCGHQLEVLQSISDQPLSVCPVCQEPSLNKLISSANFHLKGTGWYVTDFRDKDKKPANQANQPNQPNQSNPAAPAATSTQSTSTTGSAEAASTSSTSDTKTTGSSS